MIIQFHRGCDYLNKHEGMQMCFGPKGDFYTLFGYELHTIDYFVALSLIVVFVLILVLLRVFTKKLAFWHLIISFAVVVVLYLFLRNIFWLFPSRVIY